MPKEAKPKGEKKETKKKDPNAPKRALSAYMFFSKDAREEVKQENPEAGFGDIGKLIGAKWSAMSEEDKAPYVEQAEADKERYAEAKAKYDEENGVEAAPKKEKKKAAPKKSKKKAASEDEASAEEKAADDDEE